MKRLPFEKRWYWFLVRTCNILTPFFYWRLDPFYRRWLPVKAYQICIQNLEFDLRILTAEMVKAEVRVPEGLMRYVSSGDQARMHGWLCPECGHMNHHHAQSCFTCKMGYPTHSETLKDYERCAVKECPTCGAIRAKTVVELELDGIT